MLSPMDWALIESWKERGVPLHVALRGIEHAFDSYEAKKHKRTIKTLLYCQEEVEAQYAEWLESRVGSHDEETDVDDPKTAFPRSTVISHLDRSLEEFAGLTNQHAQQQDELSEALERAAKLLREVSDDYKSAAHPDARKLEESLTGIERLLDDAMRTAIDPGALKLVEAEIDAQIKPYKRHMDKIALAQTRDNLLRKRLREHFGVPRLSLFFLNS